MCLIVGSYNRGDRGLDDRSPVHHLLAYLLVERHPDERGSQPRVGARRQPRELLGIGRQPKLSRRHQRFVVEVRPSPGPDVLYFAQEDVGAGVTNSPEFLEKSRYLGGLVVASGGQPP
jgi:hypothetical protein